MKLKRWMKWLIGIVLVLAFIVFILPLLIPLPPDGVQALTYADEDGQFITVNGLETYIRERGEVGEPVILMLHGWGGSTFSWREQLDALDDAGFRVIAFDRPPYGLSQKTGDLPLSQTEQAEFTAALMDALDIETATLVGHSMGGGVIGYFAEMYPERVERLVFVDGAPRIAQPDQNTDESSRSSRLNDTAGVPSVLNAVLDFPPFNRWARILLRTFLQPETFTDLQKSAYFDPSVVTPEVAEGYQRQLHIVGWDEAMLDILSGRSFGDTPLTREQIAQITVPTLIFWGENDTWVPIASGEALAGVLDNEIYITYGQTGHLPMEEQPEAFNTDLLEFLQSS
jgi:pimeloyl-ACP methyl ester carboxylesterase